MSDDRKEIPDGINRDICPICKGSMAFAFTDLFQFQRAIIAKPRMWTRHWYACGRCGFLQPWFDKGSLNELIDLYNKGKM